MRALVSLLVVAAPQWLTPARASSQPDKGDAQQASAALGARLRYVAPAGCPDRAVFEARVAARRHAGAADTEGRTFHVEVVLEQTRAAGHISVEEVRGAPATSRRIEAADCDEVVDALALIAALALERAPARAGQGESKPRPGRHAAHDGPPPSPTSVPNQGERAAGAVSAKPAEEERAAREPDASAAAPATQVVDEHEPLGGDDAASPAHRFSLFVAALALTGSAPAAQPALSLGASLSSPGASIALKLSLSARLSLAQRVVAASGQGTAELGLAGGALSACPGVPLVERRLWLWGCGVLEAGALSAQGSDTQNARGARRLWLAAGPAAQLEWSALGPLSLHAGAEVLFPLERDRFWLGAEVVHRVPQLALRALAGLGLAVP
jgi:hypothetical protein